MTAEHHPDELLDAWLDGRLEGDDRRRVEAHLAGCERCRRQVEGLRATVEAVRAGLPPSDPPPDLASRITAALDTEDARGAVAPVVHPRAAAAPSRRRPPLPLVAAAALAASLALAVVWLGPPAGGGIVGGIAAAYEELEREGLPEALRARDPEQVERRWQQADLGFPARVFDFGDMGIGLTGGGATRLGDLPAALTTYRADSGLIACWMFPGDAAALPEPAEIRHHGELELYVYHRRGRTLVLWQEGEVLCALAGRGDAERVIALAVAKALDPAAAAPDEAAA